ncbi:MAG TPA: sugar ABC transporter substrate-binding protein [Candidatus Eisenbacteria bacterium]|jgi:multiple sugar transport system substrate-binding protein
MTRASAARAWPAAALAALAALALLAGCGGAPAGHRGVEIRFWAMGHEGEVVQELVRDFEREHPGVRVAVQQIPWSAAHEKLLTSFVGDALPDVTQLGNTWIAEFTALRALAPLDRLAASSGLDTSTCFPGVWDTNVIEGVLYGVPWYVDTRVLFYRRDLLARAGFPEMPGSWAEWRRAMEAVKRTAGPNRFAILLPANEFAPLVALALETGSPLLADDGTRGAFSEPEFRRALDFYAGLFRDRLAPPVTNNEIANLYQEFARGYFAMYITGPWNLDEFRARMPDSLQSQWATAPLPGPDGPESSASLAGGSSLVLSRKSKHPREAWALVEFLLRPESQLRFYRLSGDLPARLEAWRDPALAAEPRVRAFGEQLRRVKPTPKVPEWELIANRLQEHAEGIVRGAATPEAAAAALDREANRILEKRRWLLSRRHAGDAAAESR